MAIVEINWQGLDAVARLRHSGAQSQTKKLRLNAPEAEVLLRPIGVLEVESPLHHGLENPPNTVACKQATSR